MKNIYLGAAIIGAILPYIFFIQFFTAQGINLPAFLQGLFVNGAAGGFTVDLLLSSFIFWWWAYHDAQTRRLARWWVIIPVNLLIGLSCALPLYLYLREEG